MGAIVFLLVIVVIGLVVGAGYVGTIYLNYRRDARLEELKETKKELRQANKALNVARSSLQKVGNQYSHNPPLEALQALDSINELMTSDS